MTHYAKSNNIYRYQIRRQTNVRLKWEIQKSIVTLSTLKNKDHILTVSHPHRQYQGYGNLAD